MLVYVSLQKVVAPMRVSGCLEKGCDGYLHHLEAITHDRVIVVSAAGDGQGFGDVDLAVGEIVVVDVDAEDAADYDVDCAEGGIAWKADGLVVSKNTMGQYLCIVS